MMNKEKFIQTLKEKLNINEKDAIVINSILEDNKIIGKKGKENIIKDLINKLETNEEFANKIYETAMNIIKTEIKDRLKHPFRSYD